MLFIENEGTDTVCMEHKSSILCANSVHMGYGSNVASYHAVTVGNFSTPSPTESVVLLLDILLTFATLTYKLNLPHIQ